MFQFRSNTPSPILFTVNYFNFFSLDIDMKMRYFQFIVKINNRKQYR